MIILLPDFIALLVFVVVLHYLGWVTGSCLLSPSRMAADESKPLTVLFIRVFLILMCSPHEYSRKVC